MKGKALTRRSQNLLTRKQLALIANREWRLDNLYRIVDEQGRNVPFRRNDVQRAMWDELWFWNLILKGRQHGISSFIILMMLDARLFTENAHCGFVAATLTDATLKLDKARFAYEGLPRTSKPLSRSRPTTPPRWNALPAKVAFAP